MYVLPNLTDKSIVMDDRITWHFWGWGRWQGLRLRPLPQITSSQTCRAVIGVMVQDTGSKSIDDFYNTAVALSNDAVAKASRRRSLPPAVSDEFVTRNGYKTVTLGINIQPIEVKGLSNRQVCFAPGRSQGVGFEMGHTKLITISDEDMEALIRY